MKKNIGIFLNGVIEIRLYKIFIEFFVKKNKRNREFFLDPKDYLLGNEWLDMMKDWDDEEISFKKERQKYMKYFGWLGYNRKYKMDFEFDEFKEIVGLDENMSIEEYLQTYEQNN